MLLDLHGITSKISPSGLMGDRNILDVTLYCCRTCCIGGSFKRVFQKRYKGMYRLTLRQTFHISFTQTFINSHFKAGETIMNIGQSQLVWTNSIPDPFKEANSFKKVSLEMKVHRRQKHLLSRWNSSSHT